MLLSFERLHLLATLAAYYAYYAYNRRTVLAYYRRAYGTGGSIGRYWVAPEA